MAEYICKEVRTDNGGYLEVKKELVRCRNCKHRPKFVEPEDEDDVGYLLFPDNKCPCRCEDEWYNWMPKKDWYCGNAERDEEC